MEYGDAAIRDRNWHAAHVLSGACPRLPVQRVPGYPRVVEVATAMLHKIDRILDAAEQQEASDVFLQENAVPRLKINEQIIVLGEEPLSLACAASRRTCLA